MLVLNPRIGIKVPVPQCLKNDMKRATWVQIYWLLHTAEYDFTSISLYLYWQRFSLCYCDKMAVKSTLLEHATVIAYDEEARSLRTLRDASLLITGDRIEQLAEGAFTSIPKNVEVIDCTNKIISPGFISTHHHMWQSAFRTLGADTTLCEYMAGRYSQGGPAGRNFTPDDVYLGQLACALEIIDGGTTTVVDHAHAVFSDEHVDATINADFQCGLRIFAAHTVEAIASTGYTSQMGMKKLLELSKDRRFTDNNNPVELGVAYDAWAFLPREVNADFLDMVINHNNTVSKPNAPFSILTTHHVAGPFTAYNNPFLLHSLPNSALAQDRLTTATKIPVIFSHSSFMSSQDVRLIRAYPHVSISTTPEAEAHYGHTSVRAEMFQDIASLGTDTHFTFSSYMPSQARLWLQLLRDKNYRHTLVGRGEIPTNNPMKCDAAFLLMTQKGGEALGRSDLGVIRVGAQADLVIFDMSSSTSLWGAYDPVAAIVLHTGWCWRR